MIQAIAPCMKTTGAISFSQADPMLYGGKGASLKDMAALGMPVPMGFILPIGSQYDLFHNQADFLPHDLSSKLPKSIAQAISDLEQKINQRLGDPEHPLFLSVRSAGAISMPGMMDTFLNIGLTPKTCPALAQRLGWSLQETQALCTEQQEKWRHQWPTSTPFSAHAAHDHLWSAIQAVWNSWHSPRAQAYRAHYNLEQEGGCAVIIQSMVFGNARDLSGTKSNFFAEEIYSACTASAMTAIATEEEDSETEKLYATKDLSGKKNWNYATKDKIAIKNSANITETDENFSVIPLTKDRTITSKEAATFDTGWEISPTQDLAASMRKCSKTHEEIFNTKINNFGNIHNLSGVSGMLGEFSATNKEIRTKEPFISGTGVLFTRRPDTGENAFFGEFLPSAQGEALVSGAVTPLPLTELQRYCPEIFEQLCGYAKTLEATYADMQDIEFTIEHNVLWLLQTRSGKRTARATFRIAHDRVIAQESTREKTLLSIDPKSIDALLYPMLSDAHTLPLMAKGLPASPGAAIGTLTFLGENITPTSILLCSETSAEDVPAMLIAGGVITLRGGMTSHAAVIMRAVGKPCISGLEAAQITPEGLIIHNKFYPIGTQVTLDGSTGHLFQGQGIIETPSFSCETQSVLSWADDCRTLGVYANADTPLDIARALQWGAEGIGLCRSEHMMLTPHHLPLMQQFILAPTADKRQEALKNLEILHQRDLVALLQAAAEKHFVLRLLDPPLHEFLPTSEEDKENLAHAWSISLRALEDLMISRREINPMMGQRGCRLGLAFPELYAMQIKSLLAAMDCVMADGINPSCGVMIPLVSDEHELITLKKLYHAMNPGSRAIKFGVMIETPRAALLADRLATWVDFISFGTNDLTQMTWGLSRDDSAPITQTYNTLGIPDPFYNFDEAGVGQLLVLARDRAKKTNPTLTFSVCGEHATCPKAISFFQAHGIDSISCSPFALPRARLSAAKAALQKNFS